MNRGCIAVVLVAGCMTVRPAPVDDRRPRISRSARSSPVPPVARPPPPRHGSYIVKRGDTLYSIATGVGIDHRELEKA